MNDSAFIVQIVEAEQYLLGDLFDDMLRHTTMLVSFDQTEQILPKNLENHANVRTVGTGMFEVVHEADDVTPAGVRFGR